MATFGSFILTFALLSMVQLSQGNLQSFCQPNTGKYVGPKLPKLPSAFTAQVEANIVNRNYSFLMTEYYDQTANKGALRSAKNGKSHFSIYNYNEDEMMIIDETNKNCTVQEIQTMHNFAFFGRNGSKIEGIAELFLFGAQYHEIFIGNATVRGIPCFHWQACINHNHSSFLVDYFFSIPGWSMPFGEMQVVRAIINGTSDKPRGQSQSKHAIPVNYTRPFYHVYDFFLFKAGPPPESAFQVPRGVFCSGMKDRKMLPSLPSVFSLELESVNTKQKIISHFKEHYDINRQLVMYQFYDYRHKGYGETRIIHDFNHGVMYNISGLVCQNVTKLTPINTVWDGKETKDHHLRMKTFSESLYSRNKSALMYTGSANVRGIDADVWIIKKEAAYTHQEVTTEFYFAKPTWKTPAGSLVNQTQVLLRIDSQSGMGLNSMNVINFDGESVPLYVFNIAPCFIGNKVMIYLRLLGDWKKMVYKQELQFNIAVRKSIADAANVSSLRIDGIKNWQGQEVILVWFTLLGKPPITAPDAPVESELKDAIESLKKKVMNGGLIIQWTNPVTKTSMEVRADKYFRNMEEKPTLKPTSGNDNKRRKKGKNGVPGGAVAGIVLLMTAIGICIGLAIAHVIMKRRGSSLFQYQRQE